MSDPLIQPLPEALCRDCFVAGTDTGVGKTWVAVQILRSLQAAGWRAAGMKPVAAGAQMTPAGLRNDDALALAAASGVELPYEVTNPCCLPEATSPHLAAESAGSRINIDAIVAAFRQIKRLTDVIVVEGAGGWLAPVGSPDSSGTVGPTMQDVALALGQPVVLVVGLRLGCLSHALLTADAIRRSGLPLAGWIANRIDPCFADQGRYLDSLQARLPEPLLWASPAHRPSGG